MSNATDRNMLFGMIALQMEFINRDQLIAAMQFWILHKTMSLQQILKEQGALSDDTESALSLLVDMHIKLHRGDPQLSLAAISPPESLSQNLRLLGDTDVEQSLQLVGTNASENDPDRTATYSVGQSTSTGDRFRILRPHARGGLGEVSIAEDTELMREVALKEIHERYANDADRQARFTYEARITGGLEHPGIVPVYGLGRYVDGRPFYAMRFVRGDSLKDAIQRYHLAETKSLRSVERIRDLRMLLRRLIDVCNAIEYAHSRGVLHRDLKPSNVMLGKFGETLVVDWGLAKSIGRSEQFQASDEPTLLPDGSDSAATVMGSTVGTPSYMSPEQAEGRLDLLSPASDVYSLGATLYSILTGKAPFHGPDTNEILRKVRRGDFPQPTAVERDTPRALEAICLKAMALRPKDRYASPRKLAAEIERWLGDEPVNAYRDSWSERIARRARRHRVAVQMGAAALLIILITSFLSIYRIESARLSEVEQRKTADQARKTATKERQAAIESERHERVRLARSYLDNGITLCDSSEVPSGMLFFAKALEALPDGNPDLERAIRLNLSNWAREFHQLERILPHAASITQMAMSPDGTKVATVGADKLVRIWDLELGSLLHSLPHDEEISAIAFTVKGDEVLSGGSKLIRWSVADGQRRGDPASQQAGERIVAFSPNVEFYVTQDDQQKRLRETSSGAPLGGPLPLPDETGALAKPYSIPNLTIFTPDGKHIAVSTTNGKLGLYKTVDSSPTRNEIVTRHAYSQASCFSPDGELICCATNTIAHLIPWKAANDELLSLRDPVAGVDRTYFGLSDGLSTTGTAFSPGGEFLVITGERGIAQVIDTHFGRPVGSDVRHMGPIHSLVFSPTKDQFLTGGRIGDVKVWKVSAPTRVPIIIQADYANLAKLAIRETDQRILANVSSGRIHEFNLLTGERRQIYGTDGDFYLATSMKGDIIATRFEQNIVLWNSDNALPITWWDTDSQPAFLSMSPTGRTAYVSYLSNSGDVFHEPWKDGKPLRLNHTGFVTSSTFSSDEDLFIGTWEGDVEHWDAREGKMLAKTRLESAIGDLDLDGKSERVLVSLRDGNVYWLDPRNMTSVGPIFRHSSLVASGTSYDGRIVCTATMEGTARAWDSATGVAIGPAILDKKEIPSHVRMRDVAVSTNGQFVAAVHDRTSNGMADLLVRVIEKPITGTREELVTWIEVITGLQLNEKGFVESIPAEIWLARKTALSEFNPLLKSPQEEEDRQAVDHERRGSLLLGLGRHDQAKRSFERAHAIRVAMASKYYGVPEVLTATIQSWVRLGCAQLRSDDEKSAGASFEKAMSLTNELGEEQLRERLVRQINARVGREYHSVGLRWWKEKRIADAKSAIEHAVKTRQAILDQYPDDLSVKIDLAATWHDLGLFQRESDPTAAESPFLTALKLRSELVAAIPAHVLRHNLTWTQQEIGYLYTLLQRNDEAKTHYNAALEERKKLVAENNTNGNLSDLSQIMHNLGVFYTNTGDLPAAEESFRSALELRQRLSNGNSTNKEYRSALVWTHHQLGRALLRGGKTEAAIASFRRAAELDPIFAPAHHALGIVFRQMRSRKEATEAFEKVTRSQPNSASAWYELGRAYHDEKRLEDARKALQKSVDLDPSFAGGYISLGSVLREQGDLNGAIAAFRKAIDLDSASALAHNGLGNTLLDQRKLEEAESAYQKAIELDSKFAVAHRNLGYVYQRQQQLSAAVAAFHKAIELAPDYALAHDSLGHALRMQYRLAPAGDAFRKAIELEPQDARIYLSLANVLTDEAKLDEAETILRKALEVDPRFAEGFCRLAAVLRHQRRFEESFQAYQRGHGLSAQIPRWSLPSARWVEAAERAVNWNAAFPQILEDHGWQQSGTAMELLEFAEFCSLKAKYSLSAKYYGMAFSSNPRLAEGDLDEHRYHAACNAVLAGIGQGDGESTNDDERKKLRTQGLAWLREELQKSTRQLEQEPSHRLASVGFRMSHWQQDPDLRGIRDAEQLAQLPTDEQPALEELWTAVEALRRRAYGEGR